MFDCYKILHERKNGRVFCFCKYILIEIFVLLKFDKIKAATKYYTVTLRINDINKPSLFLDSQCPPFF